MDKEYKQKDPRIPKRTDGSGNILLPFRPIVFGGDDVTFVCDGRLGISLAVVYLKAFEDETKALPDGKGKATACVGVSIVKAHYPFARAYALAEALCASAKTLRRALEQDVSCLDWHFTTGGLIGTLDEIREREYRANNGWLNLRPVALTAVGSTLRRWDVVAQGIKAFQGGDWAEKRNKAKALRDALREGPAAVERFRMHFLQKASLPEVAKGSQKGGDTGWITNTKGEAERNATHRSLYFDALELADRFVFLESPNGSHESPTEGSQTA